MEYAEMEKIEALANAIVDSWDMQAIMEYAADRIVDYLLDVDDETLEMEWEHNMEEPYPFRGEK